MKNQVDIARHPKQGRPSQHDSLRTGATVQDCLSWFLRAAPMGKGSMCTYTTCRCSRFEGISAQTVLLRGGSGVGVSGCSGVGLRVSYMGLRFEVNRLCKPNSALKAGKPRTVSNLVPQPDEKKNTTRNLRLETPAPNPQP